MFCNDFQQRCSAFSTYFNEQEQSVSRSTNKLMIPSTTKKDAILSNTLDLTTTSREAISYTLPLQFAPKMLLTVRTHIRSIDKRYQNKCSSVHRFGTWDSPRCSARNECRVRFPDSRDGIAKTRESHCK